MWLKLVENSWAPEDQRVQQQREMVLIEEQRFCQQSSCEIITESRSWNNRGSYQAVYKTVKSIEQELGFISVIRDDVRD